MTIRSVKNIDLCDYGYKKRILAIWNEDNVLKEFTSSEIADYVRKEHEEVDYIRKLVEYTHSIDADQFRKKYRKMGKNTIKEKIKRYAEEGILVENKKRYHPKMISNPTELLAPAFFIKNKYFSKYICIPMDDLEFMYYYGHKKYDAMRTKISKEKYNIALQELSMAVKKAVHNFYDKTHEIPIVISYMTYEIGDSFNIPFLRQDDILKSNSAINRDDILMVSKTKKMRIKNDFSYSLSFIKDMKETYLFGLEKPNNDISILELSNNLVKKIYNEIKNTPREKLIDILEKYKIYEKNLSKLACYYQDQSKHNPDDGE
jgi:hypothetical protein